MKTSKLADLLRPLDPCPDGIADLLRYKIVAQAFERASKINYLLFVWFAVACADTDDVFLEELVEWCVSNNVRYPLPIVTEDLTGSIEERMYRAADRTRTEVRGLYRPFYLRYVGSRESVRKDRMLCDKFRREFRCPTDAELQLLERFSTKDKI